MCGIWGTIFKNSVSMDEDDYKKLFMSFMKLRARGPNTSTFDNNIYNNNIYLGFQRLSIMDGTLAGNQPFTIIRGDRIINIICNGEIYEYGEIIKRHKFEEKVQSSSDCEVIKLLYEKYCLERNEGELNEGIEKILKEIQGGEFAIGIVEYNKRSCETQVIIMTDPCSVRPIFYFEDEIKIGFSSELKGICDLTEGKNIQRLEGGKWMKYLVNSDGKVQRTMNEYYNIVKPPKYQDIEDDKIISSEYTKNVMEKIYKTLDHAVCSSLNSDQELGALLSGGLDSSLIVGLASKHLRKKEKRLRTFSIGMPGGTDEEYAREVAKYCNTEHTHIPLTEKDFLREIGNVIYATETFDITTIRASTGQYLAAQWIRKNTNIKVLLIGDGSDELCSGYMYFHKAPTPEESHNENCRLLKDIHLYDGLRADRGIASNGIEARMPFLKYTFIDIYLSIDPRLRIPIKGQEKWLLRKSFEGKNIIPEKILWRKKEAFSDGVSSQKRSWYQILQEHIDSKYSNNVIQKNKYNHCKPKTKESYHYRYIFEKYFGKDVSHLIPYFWLPKWCGNINEPSARVLDVY